MSGEVFAVLAAAIAAVGVVSVVASRKIADARKLGSVASTDVASLRASSDAAEREALRLGRILAAMPDGVLVVEGFEVVYANPAAARLLGGDPGRFIPTLQAAATSSVVVSVHHPVAREVRCTRTQLDSGTFLVVARDVTDARRLDQMRQDFVANASHELKTPVAAIRATAETLLSSIGDDPEASARFVDTLAWQARSLGNLVEDLLDLARLERTFETEDAGNLSAVVDDVVAEVEARASEGAAIRVDRDPDVRVRAQERDLSLAVRNLLDNALRHTPTSGTIDVTLRRENETAVLIVRDTGEGIPAKDLPRIFERFYRVDRARSRETGGTGLGLAIVRHVAETAGGTIEAASALGEGTTFTLRLPLAG